MCTQPYRCRRRGQGNRFFYILFQILDETLAVWHDLSYHYSESLKAHGSVLRSTVIVSVECLITVKPDVMGTGPIHPRRGHMRVCVCFLSVIT